MNSYCIKHSPSNQQLGRKLTCWWYTTKAPAKRKGPFGQCGNVVQLYGPPITFVIPGHLPF